MFFSAINVNISSQKYLPPRHRPKGLFRDYDSISQVWRKIARIAPTHRGTLSIGFPLNGSLYSLTVLHWPRQALRFPDMTSPLDIKSYVEYHAASSIFTENISTLLGLNKETGSCSMAKRAPRAEALKVLRFNNLNSLPSLI